MSTTNLIYKDAAPEAVTREFVHARFKELLERDGDTGLSVPCKNGLLEPPNPLPPNPKEGKRRARLKLPVLLGLLIGGTGGTLFLCFSVLR
jgi:hypothetical protein